MDTNIVLANYTVIIEGQRIVALAPSADLRPPEGAALIDGTGRYLMPGLADMHAHVSDTDEFVLLLANGITTVRNMFGTADHLQWKQEIEAGNLLAPTIYTAGPIIDGNPPLWPESDIVENKAQADSVVIRQVRAGYDFLKVYWGLCVGAFDAIAEAAKAHGIPFAGHVPDSVGLMHALNSGMKSVEHLTGYEYYLVDTTLGSYESSIWARLDTSRIRDVARMTADAGVWNCPTLVLYQNRVAPGEDSLLAFKFAEPELVYVNTETKDFWKPENNYLAYSTPLRVASTRDSHPLRLALVKALHDNGARLLLGTDYGNPFVVPGFSLLDELDNFTHAGLSPYEAIRAGTSDAAEFLGEQDEFGTVAVGQRADLLLLKANPLDDAANVRRRVGLMVRGRWLTESELNSMLAELAQRLSAEAVETPAAGDQ